VRQEDLFVLLRRQPVPALRLHLTGGMIFDIPNLAEAVITRSTIELLLPRVGDRDREAVINLLHVTWIEVIS
jgi:hypothetical protein